MQWKRRSWIEHGFRNLKHLLATGACQVQSEDAYYGHLVLRLMECLVLFYTARVICEGRMTTIKGMFWSARASKAASGTLRSSILTNACLQSQFHHITSQIAGSIVQTTVIPRFCFLESRSGKCLEFISGRHQRL